MSFFLSLDSRWVEKLTDMPSTIFSFRTFASRDRNFTGMHRLKTGNGELGNKYKNGKWKRETKVGNGIL